jgi:hypothetical protein
MHFWEHPSVLLVLLLVLGNRFVSPSVTCIQSQTGFGGSMVDLSARDCEVVSLSPSFTKGLVKSKMFKLVVIVPSPRARHLKERMIFLLDMTIKTVLCHNRCKHIQEPSHLKAILVKRYKSKCAALHLQQWGVHTSTYNLNGMINN